MNDITQPAPFPTMEVYCGSCAECYHETLGSFNPEAPRSNDIKLKDFWAVECGWQPIPPETASTDGDFLCPACGNPMALDDGSLWLGATGEPRPPKYGPTMSEEEEPETDPNEPETDPSEPDQPSKGDMLEDELEAQSDEQATKLREAEEKRLKAMPIAEKDAEIIKMRDNLGMKFDDIAAKFGVGRQYISKRYHTIKGRKQGKRKQTKKKK